MIACGAHLAVQVVLSKNMHKFLLTNLAGSLNCLSCFKILRSFRLSHYVPNLFVACFMVMHYAMIQLLKEAPMYGCRDYTVTGR